VALRSSHPFSDLAEFGNPERVFVCSTRSMSFPAGLIAQVDRNGNSTYMPPAEPLGQCDSYGSSTGVQSLAPTLEMQPADGISRRMTHVASLVRICVRMCVYLHRR
jgi:hypothetical protein